MKSKEKIVGPNGYDCQECPDWDDINGCLANETNLFKCPAFLMDILDPDYEDDDWDEEETHVYMSGNK